MLAEVLLFATMVVLARAIPPVEFGKFAIALFMQELAIGVVGGVGSALVQRPSLERAHIQAGLALALALELVLAAITFLLLAPLVFAPLFGEHTAALVQLATIVFLLTGLSIVPQALLQRKLDFPRLAQIQLASVLVGAATSLVLALGVGLDAEALVLGAIATAAVVALLTTLSTPVPLPWLRVDAARDLAGYWVPASLAGISWAGFRNADYAIVGARLGTAGAGLYWRAFQLAVEYQKKISVVMYQIAFPVLSRTRSAEDMFAIRQRMVTLLTVLVFPLLAGLAVLAPVMIPWVFGPAWESAVVPTQILTAAGAATLLIDVVGATLMAAGRPRALLAYGWGHFIAYAGAVALVAPRGLPAVAAAAVAVHVVFLVIAYAMLLHGQAERPLRRLWHDVAPAAVSCLALLAVAAPLSAALSAASIPAALHLSLVAAAGAPVYLLVLRTLFPEPWRDLVVLLQRLLPGRLRRGPGSVALAGEAG